MNTLFSFSASTSKPGDEGGVSASNSASASVSPHTSEPYQVESSTSNPQFSSHYIRYEGSLSLAPLYKRSFSVSASSSASDEDEERENKCEDFEDEEPEDEEPDDEEPDEMEEDFDKDASLSASPFHVSSYSTSKSTSSRKAKRLKCKQCEYIGHSKEDFWTHTKSHIKPEKLLSCPKCPFVTEYKHHLEYHLRNHFGSKPFKCTHCSYTCVNKSMLNSHFKSHTNVYQYRCANCSYATKYCHSLKLHLRKYGHSPASVLNSDGSVNPLPIIDVYGTRRGPKAKKEESSSGKSGDGTGGTRPGRSGDGASGRLSSSSSYMNVSPHLLASMMSSTPTTTTTTTTSQQPIAAVSPFTLGRESSLHKDNKDDTSYVSCKSCDFVTLDPVVLSNHEFLHESLSEKNKGFSLSRVDSPYLDYVRKIAPLLRQQVAVAAAAAAASAAATSSHSPSSPSESFTSYFENMVKVLKGQSQNETETETERNRERETEEEEEEEEQEDDNNDDDNDNKEIERKNVDRNKDQGETFKIVTRAEFKHRSSSSSSLSSSYSHICSFCEVAFKDPIMYSIHSGYHALINPFLCNVCGEESRDKLEFFLHIAKKSHGS